MGAAASSTNLGKGYPTPGPQSPSGQKIMDHVFFLSEAGWKQAREEGTYDLVIVGSGFCALALADRALRRDPHCRILMLERGTFFLPEHFQNLPTPFVQTLGGMSETFPWTLSARTATGAAGGTIRWQHGMIPFFGGRSTLWSAWCPRPTHDEMAGWPAETIEAANRNFDAAEALLHVQLADEIDATEAGGRAQAIRPVYGPLQKKVQALLEAGRDRVEGIYRTQAAPLASDSKSVAGIDFEKFATPAEILELVRKQRIAEQSGSGAPLHIATNCVVEEIVQQAGRATALKTSRGVVPLDDANLVLAMGTLPPTTLVQNSFPLKNIGDRFSAHFITSIVARVPRADLEENCDLSGLQIAACYIAGTAKSFERQYHIQLSCLSDPDPEQNAGTALRYMPDVVATASMAQLKSSGDHVVFVCAVLGELDHKNADNWFRPNPADPDKTTNSLLQVVQTSEDAVTWDAMDRATFEVLETILSPKGPGAVEYWHGAPDQGKWTSKRPTENMRRVDALVHESSTLHIGSDASAAPVDLDYKLRGTENVFLTGGALWPQGGSWNPTLTMVALAFDLADKLIEEARP